METPKPQLHQSALTTLSNCGVQYYRRYILGEKIPPAVAMVVGSATHKSIEMNLAAVIRGDAMLPVEQVKDVARDELEGLWKSGISLSDEELKEGMKAVKGAAIDTAIALSALHRTDLAPSLMPTAVERKFVLKLDGFPMDLAGQIDIQEGAARIRDTKTAAKSPSQTEADDSLQLTMYGLAAKVIDGIPPAEFALDALVKTKEPKLKTLKTTRTNSDFEMLLRRVERAVKVIESGAFQPAKPTDWICSRRFCGFWNSCEFASRPTSVFVEKE